MFICLFKGTINGKDFHCDKAEKDLKKMKFSP